MQIHQYINAICVRTHRLLQLLNFATLASLHAIRLLSVFAQTLTPTRPGLLSHYSHSWLCPRTTPQRYCASDAKRSVSRIHPPHGAPLRAYNNSTQIFYYITAICLGTHRLLIFLVATALFVLLGLPALLSPSPTTLLPTRTGHPTEQFQNFSQERRTPRETSTTHAHRSLHHDTPPHVDEVADSLSTHDATTPPPFRAPPTCDTLAHLFLNVGGPEISPNRLCHLLNGFATAPHTISLQEFRPTAKHHIREHERVAMLCKYHLLYSARTRKMGLHSLYTPPSPQHPRPLPYTCLAL